jgi:hypothetical protein
MTVEAQKNPAQKLEQDFLINNQSIIFFYKAICFSVIILRRLSKP